MTAPGSPVDTSSSSAPFVEVPAALPGTRGGVAAWFDFDKDGDSDIIVTGWDDAGFITKLYLNNGGSFTETPTSLVPLWTHHAVAIGDYDRDGDPDIAIAGSMDTTGYQTVARVYRNDGGTFVDIRAALDGCLGGPVLWADYDGDGDLDLLVGGSPDQGVTLFTKLYRNDHGSFVPSGVNLPDLWASTAAWGDYDKDGDLDLFVIGYNGSNGIAALYRNDGGAFVDTKIPFDGVHNGDCAFVDFDNDGDLDISYNGTGQFAPATKLYRNDGPKGFTEVFQGWNRLDVSALAWADIDRDGDMDFVESGRDAGSPGGMTTRVYRNDGGTFVDLNMDFPGVECGSLAWGDYDKDGWPDLLITGGTRLYPASSSLRSGPFHPVTKIYRNMLAHTRTTPATTAPGSHP
jgi:hypothetical protein